MNRISHKLILGMLSLTVISIVSLWIYQGLFLEGNYRASKLSSLKEQVSSIGEYYTSGQLDTLKDYVESLVFNENVSIELSSLEGNLFYSAGNLAGRMHPSPNRFNNSLLIEELTKNGEAVYILNFTRLNSDVMTYYKLLRDINLLITARIPIQPIDETISLLQKQLLNITLFLIVFSIILAVIFARLFIRPIKELNFAVNELAKGNMLSRVTPISKDEIGELAINFNHMAEELSKTDDLRKDLIANVSHELRTPLSLIKGYAEMVRDIHGEHKEKRNLALDTIIEESDRLKSMVDDILSLSQLQSKALSLSPFPFDISELCQDIVDKYQEMTKSNVLTLNFDPLPNSIVIADAKKIEQVLHNLIGNAINHTPSQGTISINISKEESVYKVIVKDNGEGIPSHELPHIWDKYYKAKDVMGNTSRGTGLGLSIVKSILGTHNVNFGVKSELGKGSEFYFELPVHHNKGQS